MNAKTRIRFNAQPLFRPIIKPGTVVEVLERGGRFTKFRVPGLAPAQELRNDLLDFEDGSNVSFDELEES